MNRLIGSIIIISLFFYGCVADQKIDEIINRFRTEYVGDLREHVFDISYERLGGFSVILRGETDNSEVKIQLLDTLRSHGFQIQDSIIVLPHNVSQTWALIDLSVATMRSKASHTAPVVSQGLMGMPVKILKEDGGWAFIQTPDRYLGWCEKAALCFVDSIRLMEWKKSPRVMITSRSTTIKDVETGKICGDVVAGCLLEEVERDGNKIVVKTPSGIIGYVLKDEVSSFNQKDFPPEVNPQKLKNTALNFIRTPYLWGGTSVHALDCSGFIKTVYRLQGIELARDASLQAGYGQLIPVNKGWAPFQTGDLLFFAPRKGSKKITHVGMYLGDSEFIHEAGKVKINSLDSTRSNFSSFRKLTLVKARRVLQNFDSEGIVPLLEHPWYIEK